MTQEENKQLFDELPDNEFSEDAVPAEDEFVVPADGEDDFDFGELSSAEKKEILLKEEDLADDKEAKFAYTKKEFLIKSAEISKPKTRDAEGQLIPPKAFNEEQPDKKGYVSKVRIEYEGSEYISLIPNVKWYLGGIDKKTGKKTLNPWFNTKITADRLSDNFTSTISKVYFKFCTKFGYEVGKLPQAQFIKELVGKKVILEQWKTTYKGSERFRIDIKEFV